MAGLGAYAYHELGWRRAVTVGDDFIAGYVATAGFAAEFCALGGKIVERIWAPLGTTDFSRYVAKAPRRGVDGYLMADVGPATQAFLEARPELRAAPGKRMVGTVFLWSLVDAGLPLGDVVAAEPLGAEPRSSPFLTDFRRVFPDLAPYAWDIWSVYFYVPMEAALRALEQVDGDLSDGQRAFRAALAKVALDAPNGRISLDERRQVVGPSYLVNYRKPASGGPPVVHTVRKTDGVEQTYNGYFSPDDPPLGRDTIRCRKADPPAWARK
jgi:branched-chain amino acid transport system substrate-binding protein